MIKFHTNVGNWGKVLDENLIMYLFSFLSCKYKPTEGRGITVCIYTSLNYFSSLSL